MTTSAEDNSTTAEDPSLATAPGAEEMARSAEPAQTESSDPEDERRHPLKWTRLPRLLVAVYAAAFVVTEAAGAFISIPLQVAMDAALVLVAINQAIFGYRNRRTAGLVMSALFTSRLFALTLPVVGVSLSTRAALVATVNITVGYLATWVISRDVVLTRAYEGFPLKAPLISLRFTNLLVVASGFLIGWLAYLSLQPSPLVVRSINGSHALPLFIAIVAFGLGAFGEELLYRRLVAAMVQHSASSQSPWISATLFGASYLGSQNLGVVVLTFFAGALFAWSCERTGSIKAPTVAHFIASTVAFMVLPK